MASLSLVSRRAALPVRGAAVEVRRAAQFMLAFGLFAGAA
jgi:hypothetical protein